MAIENFGPSKVEKCMKKIIIAMGLACFSTHSWSAAIPPATTPAPQPLTVSEFVDKLVKQDHFDRNQIVDLFQHTTYLPEVIDRINRPFEEKPWDFYKNFFITPERIQGGVEYWRAHADTLNKTAQQYGVSPAVIVAIIGIETKYGQEPGKFSELRTLATLSFHYPKRAAFFQNELENYLLLTREYNLSPTALYGSYAGALGIPQFMPSNYRQYAISYDGKASVNLLEDHADAIASIANYLQKAGWQPNQPIAVKVNAHTPITALNRFISADAKPSYALHFLHKYGIKAASAHSERKAALIVMHNTHDSEYWLTFQNFYAIMAYNPRTTYAMAIYQLSEAIAKDFADTQNRSKNNEGSIKKSTRLAAAR